MVDTLPSVHRHLPRPQAQEVVSKIAQQSPIFGCLVGLYIRQVWHKVGAFVHYKITLGVNNHTMETLLKEGLAIMDNVENPQNEMHRQLEYCQTGHDKLRDVGLLVYKAHPKLCDMIEFAQKNIPEKHHGIINHAWNEIGEWLA